MPLYILNDIISEMFKFGRTMNIKEQYYFNRGPGRSHGKFLKIYACSNFFDPPLWEFETFLIPLFYRILNCCQKNPVKLKFIFFFFNILVLLFLFINLFYHNCEILYLSVY